MPLSEKDRVERQVLRHLNFHERSPVLLAFDPVACKRFECGDAAFLKRTLIDMHARNLFRILPSPVRASEAAIPRPRKGEGGSGEGARERRVETALRSGVSVMITSDGKRRFSELRKQTKQIRQADWQEGREISEPGSWIRPEADA